jgi:hypothetical protein
MILVAFRDAMRPSDFCQACKICSVSISAALIYCQYHNRYR